MASCSTDGHQTRSTSWTDGTPRQRWEVVRQADGSTIRQGLYHAWHESGRLAEEGQYEADQRHGLWRRWHDHDPPMLLNEGYYVKGEMHGSWTYGRMPASMHVGHHAGHGADHDHSMHAADADTPDVLKYQAYDHGVPHGLWISWHDNGQVADSLTYVHGRLEGLAVSYTAGGAVISAVEYRDGVRPSTTP